MKTKYYFTLALLLLAALNLQAQQPKVIINLADGYQKIYNLADIDSLSFSNKTEKSQMQIFYSQTKTAYYPPYLIDKITMDTNDLFSVYISGFPKNYKLHTIDSIIFYPTEYPAITIGEQVWMTKNLDVDHYQNGDSIPEIRDIHTWDTITTGAWCYYNNSDSIGKIYGKHYNWYAVNDKRRLAPSGWHVADKFEWLQMVSYLGGRDNAGGKLKEKGFLYWKSPNTGATNESGFTSLPAGALISRDSYMLLGLVSIFWTSTFSNIGLDMSFSIRYEFSGFFGFENYLNDGYSVRCIKDN